MRLMRETSNGYIELAASGIDINEDDYVYFLTTERKKN